MRCCGFPLRTSRALLALVARCAPGEARRGGGAPGCSLACNTVGRGRMRHRMTGRPTGGGTSNLPAVCAGEGRPLALGLSADQGGAPSGAQGLESCLPAGAPTPLSAATGDNAAA